MENNYNNRPKAPRNMRIIMGIIMVAVYVAIGFLFIFQVGPFNIIKPAVNYSIGGVLIAYGIFRAYRVSRDLDS